MIFRATSRLAFDAGKVATESGPALPEDKRRCAELKEILQHAPL